jgi:carbonic anhydrase/acetyltransferase-like protein (isoleucine patch superfamily)
MPIYALKDREPRVHPGAYIHPKAVLIGDVHIGDGCYIGPGAVLRADWGTIRVGKGSNVQENCVVHVKPGDEVRLGVDCHVGHGAIIHGAVVEDRVLVGMGSILFDDVHVGADSVIGAGAVLPQGFQVPPGSVVAGVPAKVMGQASDELLQRKRAGTALYQTLPPLYREHLREIPAEEVKPPE